MPLHSPTTAPERILTYGPAGSGKTTGWLNIARFAQLTHSPAHFYAIDTDFAVDRMLEGYPSLDNIIVYPAMDWDDYDHALKRIQTLAVPGDWVIVDFISNAWYAIQEHFTEEVFHKDIGDYFLQVRKEMEKKSKSLGAFDGWVDWQVINAMYKRWANNLLYRGKYHLYCTAKSDTLSSDKQPQEDAQTRTLFSRYQIKPVGQKDLPFQFHTLLLTNRNGNGDRTLTAVKDRERKELSGQPISNFTTDYLVKVAGWSLT